MASCAPKVRQMPTTASKVPTTWPIESSNAAIGSRTPAKVRIRATAISTGPAMKSPPPTQSDRPAFGARPRSPVEPVRRSCTATLTPKVIAARIA